MNKIKYCKYCALDENGDIDGFSIDILNRNIEYDGKIFNIEIGNGGEDITIHFAEVTKHELMNGIPITSDKIIFWKDLKFNYCPMCGRKFERITTKNISPEEYRDLMLKILEIYDNTLEEKHDIKLPNDQDYEFLSGKIEGLKAALNILLGREE